MNENKHWYVVYTRPRWEKKVASLLQDQGVEHYCPLNKVYKQWSDRRKVVLEPLFKGYVFVAVDEAHKWDIKKVNGILNFVYWLGKPAVVVESEIEKIKKFLQEFEQVEVSQKSVFTKHDTVVIRQGLMMDYKGMVVEVVGNKVKVDIEGMDVTLSAVFDRQNLEKVV